MRPGWYQAEVHPARVACAALAAIALGCGARSTLEPAGSAGAGGASSSSPTSSSSSSGEGSGGGPALACKGLSWAGDRLFVPVDVAAFGTPDTPILVPTSEADVAVVFGGLVDGKLARVSWFFVRAPFDAWPPELLSTPDHVAEQAGGGLAAAAQPPNGHVAYLTFDGTLRKLVWIDPSGSAPLDQQSSVAGPIRFLAADPTAFLAGSGSDAQLSLIGITPDHDVILNGAGCAGSHTLAGAVPLGEAGRFLVVGTVGETDACGAPSNPAKVVQAQIVDVPAETVTPAGALPFAAKQAFTQLAVAPRAGGGAWVLSAHGQHGGIDAFDATGAWIGRAKLFVTPFAGSPVPEDAPVGLALGASASITAWARTVSANVVPGGEVTIQVGPVGTCDPTAGECVIPPPTGIQGFNLETEPMPVSGPAMLVSPDGRSILVAFADENGGTGITLVRADCID
ncbi:MAG TPA: hypothetical protein VHB21_02930 [Minicystis sp.]|nr:hypothetical protein [Minicystis sp.]